MASLRTVEDAASVSGGLWLSYLFVLFYIAVAAGAVTRADLLLESPVKLPFLGVELPLKAFFFLAPILLLITHAYTLVHFTLLAKKAGRFHDQLLAQIPGRENENARALAKREGLRGQLPSNILVQFLAGPRDVRESSFGVLLKVIAWTTLVVGPILLFLLLQIQFLPYHHSGIIWTHRITLVADLVLVWWLWRAILSGRGDFRRWRSWTRWAAPALGIVLSLDAVLLSWTVATFPGEWQEEHLPSFAIVPTKWFGPEWVPADEPFKSRIPAEWISLHEWIFDGDIDLATRRRVSLFSAII
jgi:hypothetical protein